MDLGGMYQGILDTIEAKVSFRLGTFLEDLIQSGTANISATGNSLNNAMKANSGNNMLSGMAGNDTLWGGLGNDTLCGGSGADVFKFDTTPNATTNLDTITDFNAAADSIGLENAIFTKLTATGSLASAYFKANTSGVAVDTNDYIVYNTTTGALYYDADGSGAGAKVQFATLTGHPTITAADFIVS